MSSGVIVFTVFAGWLGLVSGSPDAPEQSISINPDSCYPLVIAHRGASGYVPEHTLAAYALAITLGADYVEPDLVMTSDGHLVARHENELSLSTDISEHPEFANRFRTQTVNGKVTSGWFSEDFTLAELKTLRTKEVIAVIRPGNARLDGAVEIPTLQEILDLVKSLQFSQGRIIGIYPEIKHGSHFKSIGLAMEKPLVNILHLNGYRKSFSPVYIQSFEVSNLKELKNLTNLRLLQLFGDSGSQPFDQVELGTGLTYGEMATPQGLKEVASYAAAVGPEKSYIIPRDASNTLGTPTNFVENAHSVGLKVHPYTFRAENIFLPAEFQSGNGSLTAIGNLNEEIKAFLYAGIDGLFTDQPDVPVRLRGSCRKL